MLVIASSRAGETSSWLGWASPQVTGFSVLAVLAMLVTLALARAIIQYAPRWGLLDTPNARSLHVAPTPRGGGLAIVLVVSLTMVGLVFWSDGAREQLHLPVLPLLCFGVPLALISGLNDLYPLAALPRLGLHTMVAIATCWLVGTVNVIALQGVSVSLPVIVAGPLTVMWIVGLLNAYNFMDGIDGVASSQAVIAGAAWAWVGWSEHSLHLAVVGQTIAASAAGFLVLNRPPARVFLGDVGSTYLGFLLAAIPVAAGLSEPRFVVLGAAVVWPFVFDASWTFARRVWHHERLLRPHRTHLYQQLVVSGWSHGHVTGLYAALAAFGAVAGICYVGHGPAWGAALMAGLPVLAGGLVVLTCWRQRLAQRGTRLSPVD